MKNGWDKYASKKRYIKKGYFRKYRKGSASRETPKTSCSNSIQQSGESQEKEVAIQSYVKVLLTEQVVYTGEENESLREEDVDKTHQEGRQGIQESDQRRCKTQETNPSQTKGKKVKKQSSKEKKHEARETKAHEKKEDKKEKKSKKK